MKTIHVAVPLSLPLVLTGWLLFGSSRPARDPSEAAHPTRGDMTSTAAPSPAEAQRDAPAWSGSERDATATAWSLLVDLPEPRSHDLAERLKLDSSAGAAACLRRLIEIRPPSNRSLILLAALAELGPFSDPMRQSLVDWSAQAEAAPFRGNVLQTLATRPEAKSRAAAVALLEREWRSFVADPLAQREYALMQLIRAAVHAELVEAGGALLEIHRRGAEAMPVVAAGPFVEGDRTGTRRDFDGRLLAASLLTKMRSHARVALVALDAPEAKELIDEIAAPPAGANADDAENVALLEALERHPDGEAAKRLEPWVHAQCRRDATASSQVRATALRISGIYGERALPQLLQETEENADDGVVPALLGLATAMRRTHDAAAADRVRKLVVGPSRPDVRGDPHGVIRRRWFEALADDGLAQDTDLVQRRLEAADAVECLALLDSVRAAAWSGREDALFAALDRLGAITEPSAEVASARERIVDVLAEIAPDPARLAAWADAKRNDPAAPRAREQCTRLEVRRCASLSAALELLIARHEEARWRADPCRLAEEAQRIVRASETSDAVLPAIVAPTTPISIRLTLLDALLDRPDVNDASLASRRELDWKRWIQEGVSAGEFRRACSLLVHLLAHGGEGRRIAMMIASELKNEPAAASGGIAWFRQRIESFPSK